MPIWPGSNDWVEMGLKANLASALVSGYLI